MNRLMHHMRRIHLAYKTNIGIDGVPASAIRIVGADLILLAERGNEVVFASISFDDSDIRFGVRVRVYWIHYPHIRTCMVWALDSISLSVTTLIT